MVAFLLSLALGISASAQNPAPSAAAFDLCICQTGDAPANQIKFFKMGCKTWLASQSCGQKQTTDIKETLGTSLQNQENIKKVKIGYVGHWASASDTVRFLRSHVAAEVPKFDLQYVDIDNTACLSNDNPFEVIKYFKSISRNTANKINVRGNQVNSSGMWDPVLPGKTNFWAVANGQSLQAIFPNCTEFSGKTCYANFQKDDIGVCYNSKNQKFERLSCQKKTFGYSWQPAPTKMSLTKYENKVLHKVTFGFGDLRTAPVHVLFMTDAEQTLKSLSELSLVSFISMTRLHQIQELAKIYNLPLRPVVQNHEQTFMPQAFAVTDTTTNQLYDVFATEDEAQVFIARSDADARFLLWHTSERNN